MEKIGNRIGLFPAMMDPARAAVRKMLLENTSSAELEGKPGFWVVPKGTVEQERVFHEFEFDGAWFAIVEKEELE
jgi:hypothetical protein